MEDMKINGVKVPTQDNHGRAFPIKNSTTLFEGPAVVAGVLYKMVVYLNVSQDGRTFVRTLFSIPEEEPHYDTGIVP